MSMHYAEPERAGDPIALPDVEVFYVGAEEFEDPDTVFGEIARDSGDAPADLAGWYWWYCFPGCLPDSDPAGPFGTEKPALEDAREHAC